ncbi:MAG: hypothetical protein PHH01_00900 [Patescibacteria group bacterium]|nr:hypothetical protein [Patescibacteria group bacterium]
MKKSKKNAIFYVGAGAVLIFSFFLVVQPARADEMPTTPDPDSRITAVSFSAASSVAGATTTYTIDFTMGAALSSPGNVVFDFGVSGGCNGQWDFCNPSFTDATLSSGLSGEFHTGGTNFGIFVNNLAAGDYTLVIAGVRNPININGHYRAYGMTSLVGEEGGDNPDKTPSDPVYFGAYQVKGNVTLPNGDIAPNLGVDIQTADFSMNFHTQTDLWGAYSFVDSNVTAGTYTLNIFLSPQYGDFVAPDPIQFAYNGTTAATVNAQLQAATKTLTGTVRYNDGAPVTTGGQIWANREGGSGGKGVDLGSNGTYSLVLSGGNWNLNLNAGWDQENQRQRQVDWTYNQPPTMVSFVNDNSVQNLTTDFTVTKTNAIIKGKIVLPNGTPLPGGYVDLRKGEGQGMGGGINQDGTFSANLTDGTYQMSVNADTQRFPELSKYYLSETSVTVAANQTLDLGTITMSEKTSRIVGRVITNTGTPVASLGVNCNQRQGFGWTQGQTGADGSYTAWVWPGEWECSINQGPDSTYIQNQSGPRPSYILSANQTVTAEDIVVQLADAVINVKLVDANGNAINNMFGYAYARKKSGGNKGGDQFGNGIQNGSATIHLIGGETFVVGAQTPSDQATLLLKEEVEVAIAAGETKDVKLTMIPPDANIIGFFQDQNGTKVTNVEADVNAGSDGGGMWMNTRLQADGSFNLPVKGGKAYFLNYWFRNNPDFVQTNPDQAPFTVPVGGTVTKVVTVYRADSQITVNLLDPSGNPVSYGYIWCSNRRAHEDKITGDFEGGKENNAGSEVRGGTGVVRLVADT